MFSLLHSSYHKIVDDLENGGVPWKLGLIGDPFAGLLGEASVIDNGVEKLLMDLAEQ